MNSSKLKWLLIIIFLAANIFFLHQYVTYSTDINNYTDKEIELASEILSVPKNIIPKKKTTENVLKLEFDENFHDTIAQNIIKSNFASYVLPEGISYAGDTESLLFTNEHTFVYTASSDTNTSEIIESVILKGKPHSDSEKLVKKLSRRIGIPDSVKLSVISSFEKNGYVYISVKESISSFVIDTAVINALFYKDDIIYISGTVFVPDNVSEFSSDALDVINLLFNIDVEGSEIEKIEELYYPVTTDNGAVYLTPSFRITSKNSEIHLWDSTSCVQRY